MVRNENEQIIVDIILVSYNQEKYIVDAINSIFSQNVPDNYIIHLIIADDKSTDSTFDIIRKHVYDLAQEFSGEIELTFLENDTNLGISLNYKRSFANCYGDVVLILEGDDYWISNNHIVQHVEFLTSHPDCSMSMNEITFLHECTSEISVGKIVCESNAKYRLVDVHKQIAEGNQLGNLSACVFCGQYVRELPSELFELPIADWMLGAMMAQRGYIGILKGSTSVYRIKASGVWAGRSRWQHHKTMLREADMYNKFQHGKYHNEWQEFKRSCWRDVKRNWMHYMPVWVQNVCHKVKRK